jgi:hypothetical protein
MIILGLIILAIGVFLVIKTEWFMQNFGRIAWFEQVLGTEGGSRLGYKLLGLLAIFIGIIMISGNGVNFFTWLLSPLVPN